MLKILKHDLKEHKKFLIPYAVIILILIVEYIAAFPIYAKDPDFFPVYGLLITVTTSGLNLYVFFYTIYYLWVGSFSNRAYLTYKLGIDKKKIAIARIILAFLATLITYFIIQIFLFLIFKMQDSNASFEMFNLLDPFSNSMMMMTEPESFNKEDMPKYFTLFISAMTLINFFIKQVDVYLALALGHMANSAKKIISFLAYIGINILQSIVIGIGGLIIFLTYLSGKDEVIKAGAETDIEKGIVYIFIYILVVQLVLLIPKFIAMFWATGKKLNVQ